MTNYIIFTNIYKKPANIRYYANQNRFATYYAETKEEIKKIIKEVNNKGYEVTKVTTTLGHKITL